MNELAGALKAAPNVVPYGDVILRLLDSIFDALRYCADRYLRQQPLNPYDQKLVACFEWLNPTPHAKWKKNRHLLEGIGPKKGIPRLAALTVWRFKEIQRNANYPQNAAVVSLLMPSPLSILCDALTVPEEPASKALALAACRRLLFLRMGVYPSDQVKGPGWRVLNVDDIESELDAQRRYFEHRDNLPVATGLTAEMLQHFLALKGYYCLRFGTWKKKNLSTIDSLTKIVNECFRQKDILGSISYDGKTGRAFEFRLSPLVVDPPRALEVINELVGVPLPIRGADTLFYGGLRFSNDECLVTNIYGAAGTGKTSFALAVAATLSSYGTKCYYITTEEAREDLEIRLKSLIPAYMRGLSVFKPTIREWFHVADLRRLKSLEDEGSRLGDGLANHLAAVSRLVDSTRDILEKKIDGNTTMPTICPLIVVIDSIFGLTQGRDPSELKSLVNFIDQCRQLRALVIVLSGEELPRYSRLSYMVDVLIRLSYQRTDSEATKPERVLQLVKTRFQLSRPGSHVFHMSGREGFRISPQLPSQLDKEEQQNLTLYDEDQVIDILNRWSDEVPIDYERMEKDSKVKKFLDLFAYSHILVHGHGSSGKSGFGLRILFEPINNRGAAYLDIGVEPRRVLVVSFLYPPGYYEKRLKTIRKELPADSKLMSSSLECLAFSPGFLPPEDLVGKVARKIEEAKLRGEPFTGVLLDGVHNVFLSFPVLQEREMLWPTLYRMLSINKLTIVTTFTTFVTNITETLEVPEEREMLRKGQTPLLHAMVQAADFYLNLDRLPAAYGLYPDSILAVRDAVGRNILTGSFLLWDRHHGRLSPPLRWKKGKGPETL